MSPLGHMLRSLLRQDSYASAIARAIVLLRRDFRGSIVVEELARAVGMSVSAFHQRFKRIGAQVEWSREDGECRYPGLEYPTR